MVGATIYNHSTFADLVTTGVIELVPRPDDVVEVNPLLPSDSWDRFCLDDVLYHGHALTIVWDRTGEKFHKGRGLRVLEDGREVVSSLTLEPMQGKLR